MPELEATLYRIAQEAITNAIKHSGATTVRVGVRDVGDDVELRVSDDGSGFAPDAITSGYGLLNMRERAELLGGTFDVTSAPGAGTAVVVRLRAVRRAEPSRRGVAS